MADETGDPFNMTAVTSQNIAEVGFNPETKQGRILFNKGALYEYDNATQEEAARIIAAPSANDEFNATWRGQKPYRRLS